MATWQFDVEAVFEHGGQVLPPLLRRRAQNMLDAVLEPPWQMTEGWWVYGPEGGSRIDLLAAEDGGCELSARIDVRADDTTFMNCWLVLMADLNCSLFAPELDKRFPADITSLMDAMKGSTAWQRLHPTA